MATSVLMSATDHQPTNPRLQQDHDHQSARRSSGRRKSKGGGDSSQQQKKKNPQRGMGVEKLERLRLKDRWEKMTAGIVTTNSQGNFAINPSVPVQICKLNGYGAPNPNLYGQMGAGLGLDHFRNVGNVIGAKELSSVPVNCYSDHCNACHKKKRVNCSENVRSEMYTQMCNVGDYGFLGLNIRDNNNHNYVPNYYEFHGAKKVPNTQLGSHALGNCNKQGVEIVAVHRKGWESGGVLMEYEFFPSGKNGDDDKNDDDDDDELVMMKMVAGGGGASTETSSSSSMDNCIDLSLKLSSY